MKSQGVGATEIAKALGIGRATVYRVLEPRRRCYQILARQSGVVRGMWER